MEKNKSKSLSSEKKELPKDEFEVEAWTPAEKETCRSRYGCEILKEKCNLGDANDRSLPLDSYIVTYMVNGKPCYDIVRTPKQVSLFDMYWDKFRENLKGFKWTKGTVNPKLWGSQTSEKKKRK